MNNELGAFEPPGVVTTTLAVPAAPAGVVAVIVVALTTLTPVAAAPPMVTPVAPTKMALKISASLRELREVAQHEDQAARVTRSDE